MAQVFTPDAFLLQPFPFIQAWLAIRNAVSCASPVAGEQTKVQHVNQGHLDWCGQAEVGIKKQTLGSIDDSLYNMSHLYSQKSDLITPVKTKKEQIILVKLYRIVPLTRSALI